MICSLMKYQKHQLRSVNISITCSQAHIT